MKNLNTKILLGIVLCTVISILPMSDLRSQGIEIKLNGFGDITYGQMWGDVANARADMLQNGYGLSSYPNNTNQGFGVVGTDFVLTAIISENLTYQGEVNLQAARGVSDEIGLDFERAYIDYNFSDKFGVQAGLFFTPIGFSNRNLYARAWLMNSIQVRDIVEEETELIPSHSIGVNVYGKFTANSNHGLSYILSVINGRGKDAPTPTYVRNFDDNYNYTALLEWSIPGSKDFRIGLSGLTGKLNTYKLDSIGAVEFTDNASAESVSLREIVFNPYIYYLGNTFNFFGEYHSVVMKDLKGNLNEDSYNLTALTAELSVNLNLANKPFKPYVRYDFTDFEENHPYYGVRVEDGMAFKGYVPVFNALMVGVAYDISAYNRVKLEYVKHFDGSRREHGITVQTAFGF